MIDAKFNQRLHLKKFGGNEDGDQDRFVHFRRIQRLVDVVHEPFKNLNVTMNRDVNVVVTIFSFIKKFLKVSHVLNEDVTFAAEVLANLLVFVAHMDHYQIFSR